MTRRFNLPRKDPGRRLTEKERGDLTRAAVAVYTGDTQASIREIAAASNCSYGLISHLPTEAGVTTRPRGGDHTPAGRTVQ
ncbi:helix-turn-helix domain-containing protein [Streptomyces sp. H34-S4]|uniref:helix-turn-helix domain-containing protein n=1 Tax=Streptomyces sp. H34-S4 TaxID=2996463 RepID=UPI0022714A63|nr:hypothetical protein [Streptomyces sp. H34-S4]MCY0935980.1 hypothetical protein [Streptomyces sp. H34-S4]